MSKFLKIFGFLYLIFNCVSFTVICIMTIFSTARSPQFSPEWIFLIVPVPGMVAGYWILTGKYGWWRGLVIALSLVFSALFLFIAFVGGPQIEKIKEEKFIKTGAGKLDEDTQRMFIGVYSGNINIIREQLDKGVDVNAINESRQTALHVTQKEEIAQILIERGANVNARDDMEMTPIFNKEVKIAEILLDAGADINARSAKGNTPFLWYTYCGDLDGVRFLVSRGADINICNADNQNAVNIAEQFHPHTDVIQYLISLGITPCK